MKFTVKINKTRATKRREDEKYAGARSRGANLALKKPGGNIVSFEHQCKMFQLLYNCFQQH